MIWSYKRILREPMLDGPRNDKWGVEVFPVMKHLLLSDVRATFEEDKNAKRAPF